MSEEIESARGASGWKDFLASAFLVAAVGAILLTGWVLKGERPAAGPADAQASVDVGLGSKIAPEPAAPWDSPEPSPPQPPIESPAPSLAERAVADAARLPDAGGAWTAQLVVGCRPETVLRMIAASGGAADLYVLPAELNGASCFRVCWGTYATRDDAAAAADLPAALRGSDKPRPAEIAKVLP
jgi:septal ring-binding cell division protein DamX